MLSVDPNLPPQALFTISNAELTAWLLFQLALTVALIDFFFFNIHTIPTHLRDLHGYGLRVLHRLLAASSDYFDWWTAGQCSLNNPMLLPQCHLFLFSSFMDKIAKDMKLGMHAIDMESPAFINIMVVNDKHVCFAEKTSWKVLFTDLLWDKKKYCSFTEKVRLKRQANRVIIRTTDALFL